MLWNADENQIKTKSSRGKSLALLRLCLHSNRLVFFSVRDRIMDIHETQASNDQGIAEILNERKDSLDNFLRDKADEQDIANVKAFICFSLSNHLVLKIATDS